MLPLRDSSLAKQRALMLLAAVACVHARGGEAYVVHLLPLLLGALADGERSVRECAASTLVEAVAEVLSLLASLVQKNNF